MSGRVSVYKAIPSTNINCGSADLLNLTLPPLNPPLPERPVFEIIPLSDIRRLIVPYGSFCFKNQFRVLTGTKVFAFDRKVCACLIETRSLITIVIRG